MLLDRFIRFFFHGLVFYALMFGLFSFIAQYVAIAPFLMYVPVLAYSAILGLLFLILGSLNWLLTSLVWDTSIRGGFHGHLSHGFALFMLLGALSYFEVSIFVLGSSLGIIEGFLARAGGILFFSLLYGYIARGIALTQKEE
jgi:hypothetical protein